MSMLTLQPVLCLFVRVEGLEPPCLAASDPKSDTSTNFATPAMIRVRAESGERGAFALRSHSSLLFWGGKGKGIGIDCEHLNKLVYDQ